MVGERRWVGEVGEAAHGELCGQGDEVRSQCGSLGGEIAHSGLYFRCVFPVVSNSVDPLSACADGKSILDSFYHYHLKRNLNQK